MSGPTDLDLAQLRATEARTRLNRTLEALQARLKPQVIARDALDRVTDTGEKAIEAGIDTARRHPGKIAGVIGLAAAVLARRRIAALFARKPPDRAKPAAARRVPPRTPPAAPIASAPIERISE